MLHVDQFRELSDPPEKGSMKDGSLHCYRCESIRSRKTPHIWAHQHQPSACIYLHLRPPLRSICSGDSEIERLVLHMFCVWFIQSPSLQLPSLISALRVGASLEVSTAGWVWRGNYSLQNELLHRWKGPSSENPQGLLACSPRLHDCLSSHPRGIWLQLCCPLGFSWSFYPLPAYLHFSQGTSMVLQFLFCCPSPVISVPLVSVFPLLHECPFTHVYMHTHTRSTTMKSPPSFSQCCFMWFCILLSLTSQWPLTQPCLLL